MNDLSIVFLRVLVFIGMELEMSILECHLGDLHNLHLCGQFLNFLLQFFILLVQIGGLLVGEANAVKGEGGGNASSANLRVPQVALTFDDAVKFGTKDENHRRRRAQLSAHKAKEKFNIRTRIGHY